MSDWDFLWGLSGQELIDAMSSGGTAKDWAYIEQQDRREKAARKQTPKESTLKNKKTHKKQGTSKKQNTALFIDGENISHKKADNIIKAARQQGVLRSSRVYGLQKDEHTKGWTDKAKECGIKDIRLYGGPQKDKTDRKIQKDARREIAQQKSIDIVCIATSDKGYVDTVRELREQGKRVVIIGEDKTPDELRNACNEFIEI